MLPIIHKLQSLLCSPYPELRKRWKTVVFPPLLVFFILYFLQPLGISTMEGSRLLVLSGYALVSLVMLAIVVYVLPALFPAWYREEQWTVGKELLGTLLMCVLIVLGNWCYTAWVFELEMNWKLLYICLLWMLFIGPFPIVIFMMWTRNLQLKRNLCEALEINLRLSEKLKKEGAALNVQDEEARVVFADGIKDTFAINIAQFLYAEADGNYIRLNYLPLDNGRQKVKLLRLTLKQMEEMFSGNADVMKCHRAFLVNLRKVVKVTGNAQGYRLHLEGCEEEVPVSRSYVKEVRGYWEIEERKRL